MDKVTAGIILDTRRPRQDNTYPVKLRINYKRNRQYYNIGYFLTEEEFAKVMGDKPRNRYRDLKDTFDDKKKEARDMIDKMPVFNFESFKRKFFDSSDYSNLFAAFKYHISKLEKSGQAGTASTYVSAQASFKEFFRKGSIPFTSINAKVLSEYETYMKAEGKSITTVSMYIRCVRRLYNLAIAAGEVKMEYYPFGSQKSGLYEVPEARNHKRAISKEDVRKIRNYNALEGSPEQFARDIWALSYLSNGMNLSDIFRLKYKNIEGDTVIFIRHKTSHNRKIKPVIVALIDELQVIIDRWGNKPVLPNSYVFNILSDRLTPAVELAKIKQATKSLNLYVGRIAKEVGIEQKVTSYTARHSFATVLKLSGENVTYISEALGHSNLQTTENYLASFDQEHRKKAAKKLL
jgi:integrase